MCPRAGTKMACRLRWLGFGTTIGTQMASWRIKIGRIGRPPRRPRRKFATHKNNGKKQREPPRRLALGLVALLGPLLGHCFGGYFARTAMRTCSLVTGP